ncbi:hypothetical protein RCL_jg12752.t1 [Rhizophagus clarus]|uniref:Uncharacterized protein n=1 Tax=Rhizophagus clarus TaxID=94130 RepID=A0A8H3KVF3_9GLOM|nr:hypothetical protein RCL_jg12752.t1 [Rhizophagus clarus]
MEMKSTTGPGTNRIGIRMPLIPPRYWTSEVGIGFNGRQKLGSKDLGNINFGIEDAFYLNTQICIKSPGLRTTLLKMFL